MNNRDPIEQIIDNVLSKPVILLSARGHGKSTSLMTVIKRLKEKHPNIIIKVFDVSQVWYHRAPLKHRQRIINDRSALWENISDCIYEIGSLSDEDRRLLVGIVVMQDYFLRYDLKLKKGEEYIKTLPPIIYVFEEANTYFDSYSLRKKEKYTPAFRDFVSVGRNYGLSAFLVVTAEIGELSPGLRRRSTRLIGQIVNDYDLRMLNRKVKQLGSAFKERAIKLILDKSKKEEQLTFEELDKEIRGLGDLCSRLPRFHWIYYSSPISEIFRIRDEVTNIPKDYVINIKVEEPQERPCSSKEKFVKGIIIGAIITIILLYLSFRGI